MSGTAFDIRLALRTIRKTPGFSVVVALTLTLGIGINAAVFGMMDAMLFRPFQFPDYERIVVVWEKLRGTADRDPVAPATFLHWSKQARSVEQISAWESWNATCTDRNQQEPLNAVRVTRGFFDLLGRKPMIGRSFLPDEENPGNHRRIILSNGMWQRRFGGDPGVIGSNVLIDGEPYTVIGIAPPRFDFPLGAQAWAPLAFDTVRAADRVNRTLTVIAKTPPGRTIGQVQAEMDVVATQLARQFPDSNRDRVVVVNTLSDAFREGSSVPLFTALMTSAGLVLLVACLNIAGLLLARGMERQRELALRTALGSSRMRLVRLLVIETVVLALLASGLAIALAGAGLSLLRSSLPAEMAAYVEGWNNLGLDPRLLFAIPVFAIVAGVLTGVLPALASTREQSAEALKEAGRGGTRNVAKQRMRQTLVAGQIALALALLVAAGLTVSGGMRLASQPGGFDSERLLTAQVPIPDNRYVDAASKRELAAALLARMEAIGTIEHSAIANILPASGWSPSVDLEIDGYPVADPSQRPRAGYRSVSAGYFDTLRIPLVAGRRFSDADWEESEPVAIVSRSFAQRYWAGTDAVGKRIRLDRTGHGWVRIVGIAGDVNMYNWWDGVDYSAVYVPLRQAPVANGLHVAVRTQSEPALAASAVREAVRSADAALAVHNVRTMRESIDTASLGLRWIAWLLGLCGGISGLLAMVGVYSVMAYSMSQRRQEFAVRIALGATAADLLRHALKQVGTVSAAGIGAGILLAVALGRLLANAMSGIVAVEFAMFAMVSAVIAVVSIVAAYLPARRVMRLDPATVLRTE